MEADEERAGGPITSAITGPKILLCWFWKLFEARTSTGWSSPQLLLLWWGDPSLLKIRATGAETIDLIITVTASFNPFLCKIQLGDWLHAEHRHARISDCRKLPSAKVKLPLAAREGQCFIMEWENWDEILHVTKLSCVMNQFYHL